MSAGESSIRQLAAHDHASLSFLIQNAEYVYRHLDWRPAIEWLGRQPFLGLDRSRRLVGALACPQDATPIRWIRLFSYLDWNETGLLQAWQSLFAELCRCEAGQSITIAALGLQPWFEDLLQNSNFNHPQDIIVLTWQGQMPPERPLAPEILLRPMLPADIPDVTVLDRASFAPLWHQTEPELEQAFTQAVYATVAEMDREIIGYQISTGNPFHAHLARLAVAPALQRLSIGYAIVKDMLETFVQRGIQNISVNTQSDNYASQALYLKLGFAQTGEAFPVYTFNP